MKDLSELSYEQAYSELEAIVEKMGSGSVPLDELMKMYEQGTALAAYCDSLLKGFESKLQKLSPAALEIEADDGGGSDDGGL